MIPLNNRCLLFHLSLRQGDSVRICITKFNASTFHVEDVLTLALTQPTTGVAAQTAIHNGEISPLASKVCSQGVCNIITQVASRFFSPIAGPIRIVGVSLLNMGPANRRRLAVSSFGSGSRRLQASESPASSTKGGFELHANVNFTADDGNLTSAPPNQVPTASCRVSLLSILLLSVIVMVAMMCLFARRRKKTKKGGDASETCYSPPPPTSSNMVPPPPQSLTLC